jgi:hypothetical protein
MYRYHRIIPKNESKSIKLIFFLCNKFNLFAHIFNFRLKKYSKIMAIYISMLLLGL